MKARNIRLGKRVVAFAVASTFVAVGTSSRMEGNLTGNYPNDLSRGIYYDEDVKKYQRELDFIIKSNSNEKSKELVKVPNVKPSYNRA